MENHYALFFECFFVVSGECTDILCSGQRGSKSNGACWFDAMVTLGAKKVIVSGKFKFFLTKAILEKLGFAG
jgi:hypothetical protein